MLFEIRKFYIIFNHYNHDKNIELKYIKYYYTNFDASKLQQKS